MDTEIDQQTLMKWRKALAAEDCRQVKKLFEDEKRLVNLGWEAEGQAWVELQVPCTKPTRTALHVAARRGDFDLMEQILGMASDGADDATGKPHKVCTDATNCHLLKVVDGYYELDALAMAVVNGSQDIVSLLKRASLRCNTAELSNPYEIGHLDPEEKEEDEKLCLTGGAIGKTITEKTITQSGKDCLAPDYAEFVFVLSKVTNEVLEELSVSSRSAIQNLYDQDCDFNFLPISVYLFHFTFSSWNLDRNSDGNTQVDLMGQIRKKLFSQLVSWVSASNLKLASYLLFKLWDGQGRTALHVAVDFENVGTFTKFLPAIGQDRDLDFEYLNVIDSVGRTPLYRAAAANNDVAVTDLLLDPRTNIFEEVVYHAYRWGRDLDIDKLSRRNSFKSDCVFIPDKKIQSKGFNTKLNAGGKLGRFIPPLVTVTSTALHISIIHQHERIVESLLDNRYSQSDADDTDDHSGRPPATSTDCSKGFLSDFHCKRPFSWPVMEDDKKKFYIQSVVSTMHLTVLVGNSTVIGLLLKDAKKKQQGQYRPRSLSQEPLFNFRSFHLAAAIGDPELIKAFLSNGQDPWLDDNHANTALHYALKGRYVKCHPHIIDFVGCNHVFSWRRENDDHESAWLAEPQDTSPSENNEIKKRYAQRQGSINLLLQAGITVWTKNEKDRTASPQADAPAEFVTWWHEKVAEETDQKQGKLNAAANAISVTAALVATASYLGPFTPPLGYGADTVQIGILAIRIFVVCNSLSFYFALAAIMYALLPSLSTPKESKFEVLYKTRILVGVALVFLLPSIIFVLITFAASYIAASSDHGLAHHSLTLVTIVIGGFVCLVAILRFSARLMNVFLTLPKEVFPIKVRSIFLIFLGKIWSKIRRSNYIFS